MALDQPGKPSDVLDAAIRPQFGILGVLHGMLEGGKSAGAGGGSAAAESFDFGAHQTAQAFEDLYRTST